MSIYLLRHAHTEWNGPPKRFQGYTDVGISKKNHVEIELFINKSINFSRIISSPARRCRETIAMLFPSNTHQITFDERLWEINMGYFTGLLETEAQNLYPHEWAIWKNLPSQISFGNNGSLLEIQTNMLSILNELFYKNADSEDILIVTHGGPIRVLKCFVENQSLDNYHQIVVNNLDCFECLYVGKKYQLNKLYR